MSYIGSSPGDFIIGKVTHHYRDNEYSIEVTHIGRHNKSFYNGRETVQIQNKLPRKMSGKKLIGTHIKCLIQYREEYNRLLCTVDECSVETKTTFKIKIIPTKTKKRSYGQRKVKRRNKRKRTAVR